jgi:hypothetical protein
LKSVLGGSIFTYASLIRGEQDFKFRMMECIKTSVELPSVTGLILHQVWSI